MPEHAALRAAYLDGAVVLTPNPAAHALFANKHNLAIFSDPDLLQRLGASTRDCEMLAVTVPRTIAVTRENAVTLWTERRRYFFKPAAGYGAKAAYRGDKLTKAVWASILAGSYVAQRYIAPGARSIRVEDSKTTLKADIRLFRYCGETLLLAARLYQGQTTNFRTTGGGFAAVFVADYRVGRTFVFFGSLAASSGHQQVTGSSSFSMRAEDCYYAVVDETATAPQLKNGLRRTRGASQRNCKPWSGHRLKAAECFQPEATYCQSAKRNEVPKEVR